MALKPCEVCGREITDLFYSCPHCGAKCPPPKSVGTPSSEHGARSEVREDAGSPPASGSPPAAASRHTTHILSPLKKIWADRKAAAAERKAAAERAAAATALARKQERRRIEDIPEKLLEIVSSSFLVKSCPSCYESAMRLLSVSPNGRSIEYKCDNCGKRRRAVAANPKAQEVTGLFRDFGRYYRDSPVVFTAPSDPLPYEQTVREPIPETVRTQVWRRDGGQCVRCGRKENLQFDHIIPVKKGGATTANNLQVLCRSCNLSKGTKI